MQVIGLSGYARSGKDETAKILMDEFGFIRVSFADKLREVLYALDPIVDAYMSTGYTMNPHFQIKNEKKVVTVQEVIDTYGWDGYKESQYGTEIRRLLQKLGTEAGRQTLWDSIWIDAAFAGVPDDANVVVTDCRFHNEAQAIKDRGGEVWRINRPGVGPANSHASETSMDDWDFDVWLENDGTLEQFKDKVIGLGYWQVPVGSKL